MATVVKMDPELAEQIQWRAKLLLNPNAADARAWATKYCPEMVSFNDDGLLGGLHKARVQLGIEVKESLAWLHEHGMSADIPDEFMH